MLGIFLFDKGNPEEKYIEDNKVYQNSVQKAIINIRVYTKTKFEKLVNQESERIRL